MKYEQCTKPKIAVATRSTRGEVQSVLEGILLILQSDLPLGILGVTIDNGAILFGSAPNVTLSEIARIQVPVRVPIRFVEAERGRLSLQLADDRQEVDNLRVCLRLTFTRNGLRQVVWEAATSPQGCRRLDLEWLILDSDPTLTPPRN